MAKLKLLDAVKAEAYGLTAKDQDESDALKKLSYLGEDAKVHLEYAIASGAFEREKLASRRSSEVTSG